MTCMGDDSTRVEPALTPDEEEWRDAAARLAARRRELIDAILTTFGLPATFVLPDEAPPTPPPRTQDHRRCEKRGGAKDDSNTRV